MKNPKKKSRTSDLPTAEFVVRVIESMPVPECHKLIDLMLSSMSWFHENFKSFDEYRFSKLRTKDVERLFRMPRFLQTLDFDQFASRLQCLIHLNSLAFIKNHSSDVLKGYKRQRNAKPRNFEENLGMVADYDLKDKSYQDIALDRGMNRKTVESRITRFKERYGSELPRLFAEHFPSAK